MKRRNNRQLTPESCQFVGGRPGPRLPCKCLCDLHPPGSGIADDCEVCICNVSALEEAVPDTLRFDLGLTGRPDADTNAGAVGSPRCRCWARSGDKGGNADIGAWTRSDDAYGWLSGFLTVDALRELLPETAPLVIERYELPNTRWLNFVVDGLLGDGVASSTRFDAQAKSLGEWL